MSEFVAHRRVDGVFEHPQADKLAVIKVGEFSVVHGIEEAGRLKKNDIVTHFPTDICIDPEKAVQLGVSNYLKTCEYKNQGKQKCRIVAARLRGVPSYGFISLDTSIPDDKLDEYYGVWKYEPPEPVQSSERERWEHAQFPKYTKIKRYQLYPQAWEEGIPVRITEKIHGSNVRLGLVQDDDWRFMVGSHNVIVKESSRYWNMLTEPVMNLLSDLCNDGKKPVVVYGEMFGKGVQDLDYGCEEPELRVFDIMVDGRYLDWILVEDFCKYHGVKTVPLIYKGPFSWSSVRNFTDGLSMVKHRSKFKSAFKGREGIVITPLEECYSDVLKGRLIAKSVSVDYESRRGGTEYH